MMSEKERKESTPILKRLEFLFLKRGITIEEDLPKYRRMVWRGFLAAFIFSILFGIYEYYIVYNDYVGLYSLINETIPPPEGMNFNWANVINWSSMYGGLLLTVALATRYDKKFNIEPMIMGLLFMAMFEDWVYWMCQWIDRAQYPYPAGNWWDSMFASFRVLGGLGQPLEVWPFVPLYYIWGFIMALVYYLSCIAGPKVSRSVAWGIGPLFIAIIFGTFDSSEVLALIFLIALPTISYIYVALLLVLNKRKN